MLERLRAFFAARGVLEVETPILSAAATPDLHLQSFSCRYTGPDPRTFYLHTSPEFAMKRLLAAGEGSIYQLGKVFRDGEAGRLHNPEFTMLEWYRVGFDHHRLMAEVVALVTEALEGRLTLGAPDKLSYQEAFERHCGIDPHTANTGTLLAAVEARGVHAGGDLARENPDVLRDLLLTHLVEPHLGRGRLTLLHDYPASQAALARIRPGTRRSPSASSCILKAWSWRTAFTSWATPRNSGGGLNATSRRGARSTCRRCQWMNGCWKRCGRACRPAPAWRSASTGW